MRYALSLGVLKLACQFFGGAAVIIVCGTRRLSGNLANWSTSWDILCSSRIRCVVACVHDVTCTAIRYEEALNMCQATGQDVERSLQAGFEQYDQIMCRDDRKRDSEQVGIGRTLYTAIVSTGGDVWAGSESIPTLKICGTRNNFTYTFPKHRFQPSTNDTFKFEGSDVGHIDSIVVHVDRAGASPGWYLNWIILKTQTKKYDGREKVTYIRCTLDDWLLKDNGFLKYVLGNKTEERNLILTQLSSSYKN